MSNPKEVAQKLYKAASQRQVRFPKIWDEQKIVQACGTTLVKKHLCTLHVILYIYTIYALMFIDASSQWSRV